MVEIYHNPEDMGISFWGRNVNNYKFFIFKFGGNDHGENSNCLVS